MLLLFLLILAIFALTSHTTHVVIDHLLRAKLEALFLELIVLDELIGTAIVSVSFVENVLAHLLKGLGYVEIQIEQILDYFLINLGVFIVDLLL